MPWRLRSLKNVNWIQIFSVPNFKILRSLSSGWWCWSHCLNADTWKKQTSVSLYTPCEVQSRLMAKLFIPDPSGCISNANSVCTFLDTLSFKAFSLTLVCTYEEWLKWSDGLREDQTLFLLSHLHARCQRGQDFLIVVAEKFKYKIQTMQMSLNCPLLMLADLQPREPQGVFQPLM